MIRRGIAMEVARLLPVEAHQDILGKWFGALEDEPADPDRYAKTAVAQIHKADAEVFRMFSQEVKTGIARRPDGVYPLEAPLARVLASARIQQILQPLVKLEKSVSKEQNKGKADPVSKQVQDAVAHAVAQALKKRGPGGGGGDGGGNKGDDSKPKGKGSKTLRPKELFDMDVTTKDGEPICFGFNLDGCDKAAPGERCYKGFHVCARKGCQKAHPQRDHK